MKKQTVLTIILVWLAWAGIVIGFQAWAVARINLQYPDRVLGWTTTYTKTADYQSGWAFLTEPFMNNQVAWDSEYYLGIAVGGYNDPRGKHLTPQGVVPSVVGGNLSGIMGGYSTENMPLSYAFFPFYPWVTRLVAYPLKILGMNPIATATLAGVIVSALGALAGMLALYDLTRETLGEEGGLRAAFYMIIFPAGFFLVQIYTEGLFVGLAFWCLALLKRGRWVPAALLGACATLTRAVGAALFIPMFITWVRSGDWLDVDLEWRMMYYYFKTTVKALWIGFRKSIHAVGQFVAKLFRLPVKPFPGPDWAWVQGELKILTSLIKMLIVFSPAITFLIWKLSYLGLAFSYVESNYFGRGFLALGQSYYVWATAFHDMIYAHNPAGTAYYLIELGAITLGVVACVVTWKRYPELAWFSLAVFILSIGSGGAQGMIRYVMGAPVVFIALASWGRNPVFDRAWTILSLLLMGMLAVLFSFNMWVA